MSYTHEVRLLFTYKYINFIIIPILFLLTTYVQKKSKNTYRKKPYLLNLFLIGYLFGVGFFLTGTYWISHSLTFDENFKFLVPISIIGLPVFSGSPEKGVGIVYFTGPTMGYLIGFLLTVYFAGSISFSKNLFIKFLKRKNNFSKLL